MAELICFIILGGYGTNNKGEARLLRVVRQDILVSDFEV